MIRKFKYEDKLEYLKMSREFYNSSAVLHTIEPANVRKTFDEIIQGSDFVEGFIIEEEKETIGYALVSFTYSNEFGGKILLLEELYIRPLHQQKGYGTKFLNYIEDYYQDEIIGIRLEVTKDNEVAMNLYNNIGFDTVEYQSMIKIID